MTDPLNAALSAYGAVGVFAQQNPELMGKLNEAVANGWDAARFERELWTTNWYKTASDAQKQLQVLAATNPGEYNQQLGNVTAQIAQRAASLGVNVDAHSVALWAMNGGWANNSAMIDAAITDRGSLREYNGMMTGTAGEAEKHVRETFASYGLQMSEDWYQNIVKGITSGRLTTGGMDNEAIGYASKMYPMYTQDFLEGRTLNDIAQPFMQHMGQTLEIDPSSINLNDPTIKKALQGDGKVPMTMWQFDQQLKNDPRWAKTDGAKNAAYGVLAQIGKDWGFM